jgi:hypothetical protein
VAVEHMVGRQCRVRGGGLLGGGGDSFRHRILGTYEMVRAPSQPWVAGGAVPEGCSTPGGGGAGGVCGRRCSNRRRN